MTLIEDFKKVLLRSWSIRLTVLSAIAGALAQFQEQIPNIQAYVDPHLLGPISIACALGATVARVIHQENISGERHGDE
ncbi:DUF7940 domain-containing protein [Paraburkholderia youngii]|uniref:DUF7940 domain-containing protein n=1 Tax=Paraburkholderia youngii TaxID=2782701 RepID=UPI00158FA757|nr:hypothetical protein [Paraburkholderia youngii]NUX58649.1 hypothetical protein [Paraburkholderia youngii]